MSPSSNGCGTRKLGLRFSSVNLSKLDTCCNKHDICYSTCGVIKSSCDYEFLKCLLNSCLYYSLYDIVNFGEQLCMP